MTRYFISRRNLPYIPYLFSHLFGELNQIEKQAVGYPFNFGLVDRKRLPK